MKSAKTMLIVAGVVFLTLSLAGHSAGKVAPTPKLVEPTPKLPKLVAPDPKPTARTPARAARTPARATRTPARAARTPRRAATTPVRATPTPVRIKPAGDPYKDSVILVEAFMVQVRLSALRSLGVPQISQGSDSVSADHILKLLKDTDAAVVTAGAKLALGQASKAKTDLTARKRIYTDPPEKKKTEYVDVGTSFTAVAEVRREKKIFAELEFEHDSIEEGDAEAGPGTLVKRNWSVSLYLEPGKPTLVGATQDVHTAAFLVITASIKK